MKPRVSGAKGGVCKTDSLGIVREPSKARLRRVHSSILAALPIGLGDITASTLKQLEREAFASSDTAEFRRRYLDACVLKRWQGNESVPKQDRVDTAISKLMDSEIRVRASNAVFYGPECLDSSNAQIPMHLLKVYRRARRLISALLGPLDFEEFARNVEFSPGATTEFNRSSCDATNKWALGTHVTPRAAPYASAYQQWLGPFLTSEGDSGPWPELQVGWFNEVFTVPKRFDTERTACKGRTWNVALQKGYGKFVRKRAQRWSEPLLFPEAQVYHGLLAKLGSATRLLVTGDLSGASDGIGTGHIKTFFPESHAALMLDLREELGTYPDGTITSWEKVGSMGNGFTFEVETVLFYAVVKACCKRSELVSVYGDDLIYPEHRHDDVVEAMSFLGFEFNREKTYSGNSPFRESCGSYFYNGVDVKPFFIESLPWCVAELVELHNQIIAHNPEPDSPWWRVVAGIKETVDKRYRGPYGTPGVIWSAWDETQPTYHRKTQSFSVFSVAKVVPKTELIVNGALLRWEDDGRRRLRGAPFTDRFRHRGALTGFPLEEMILSTPSDVFEDIDRSVKVFKYREVRTYVDRVQWMERRDLTESRLAFHRSKIPVLLS